MSTEKIERLLECLKQPKYRHVIMPGSPLTTCGELVDHVEVRGGKTQAIRDMFAERVRQISQEGWTAEHDDSHAHGEMAHAAAAYCLGQSELTGSVQDGKRFLIWRSMIWPWSEEWWKPKSTRENLVRAAALILAEIERIDRDKANKAGA